MHEGDQKKDNKALCKLKRDEFNRKIQQSLLNHTDSGSFWAAVRAARQKLQTTPQIAKQAWYTHFSSVYAPYAAYPILSSSQNSNHKDDSGLDAIVTTQEVHDNLKNLKQKRPRAQTWYLMSSGN